MEVPSSNIKKFLIFSQKRAFLIFRETEIPKKRNFLIFQETYISRSNSQGSKNKKAHS